ncbi:hypothetical protein, variant 1 [Aphanomyces astaci]|uniref:DNA recombination and repair protein Rad51-like C-terminal domain-containing protein n=1 Tax=Aphanomyces astaci TaxID=112090 RepID=W4G2N0_APHAT|nr:hypothetical protein, variant 1 [Aphanomyces astaci]ETV73188.1 hypothetical protein, variant 1 [Aphanomyces astaci]|eukprot:XP_009837392.1 hypothetical protein, variant 1 [Aphanomyces astaci]
MWALDETALDVVQRTWYDHPFVSQIGVVDAMFPDGIQSRSVVEVYGDAQSPKSLLLQHVCAAYLVHDKRTQVHYFDHECMVDANEMRQLVQACMSSNGHDGNDDDVDGTMERLFVYHAETSDDWSAKLHTVHTKLLAQSGVLPVIAVDCIGSFHAIDKMIQHRLQDTSYRKPVNVYGQLKDLVRQHSATIFAAKNCDAVGTGSKHVESMPSEWTSQVTKRLHVRYMSPFVSIC